MTTALISKNNISWLIIQAALMILLPVVSAVIWKIKSKAPLKPFIVGMIIFPVFALGLESLPKQFLLTGTNSLSLKILSNPVLFYLVAALCAGVFEEIGRFVGFKFLLKNNTEAKDSISYGLGHGGIEAVIMALSVINLLYIGIAINNGGASALGLDAATENAVVLQLSAVTGFTAFLAVFERLSAIILHVSMSVLVFASVNRKGYKHLLLVAILLHTLADFEIALYASGIVNITTLEIIVFATSVCYALFAKTVYNKIK